ncbi:MAG: Eco57I restriction-modification methylase domain-containing protein [Sedimentisphaerales bacterium]|nr:Eco57I restriction-modification methylase domain-containing protein [Sedimentisphaerales bacterium]
MSEDVLDNNLQKINKLVDGFRVNFRNLRDEQISEAVIRQEYIDPFWILLGWDVTNSAHRSSAEKDVVIEATVGTIENEKARSRRPDYIFRIDGFPRFVVEAKKPAIDLKKNKDAIFQAKTYAWSAQIPFVILTNFEQFRLFDATIKPYHSEPERGIIDEFDLGFEDYINQWSILQKVFGRESVAKGSLEQLLAKIKHVRKGRRIRGIDRLLIDLRGSEPVDRAFLKHLEDFRLRFARALFDENRADFPDPHTHHGAARLTEATQRLIDRLVFIRVCEDRDITTYGELREIVNNSSKNRLDLYQLLTARFRRFDEEYNGYLFKPHFSEQLKVPSELLADFIRSLYLPEGAYRFDAIGDDILGIIYERFLGSVITIYKNQVDAQEKPEVRHAGGVYYTPRFVVDTIIRRVIGPKINEKSPLEVLNVKILDPACGSGSFLITALQFLIDHCIKYVSKHPESAKIPVSPRAKEKKIDIAFKDDEDNWHLTPKFRSQLLASCIHGVDIDSQAVEVTIMSLYLKLLEGRRPPNWQREFLRSRLLPPLDNNICCGNSLLSQTDFDKYWDNKFGSLFGGDEDLRFRINAFDWNSHTRGFGRLFDEHKGFDCIIGNPPYIRVQELKKWEPEECEFYKTQYKSAAKGNYDIYVVFIERGLQLLASDGLLGFICPHKFWQAVYGKGIRQIIAKGKYLVSIIDFADQQVFRGATTYTAIHVFSNTPNEKMINYARIARLDDGDLQCRVLDTNKKLISEEIVQWEAAHPSDGEGMWHFPKIGTTTISSSSKMHRFPLSELVNFSQGFKTGADRVFVINLLKEKKGIAQIFSQATGREYEIESSILRPLIKSEHMRRFEIYPTTLCLIFPYLIKGAKWRILEPEELEKKYSKLWSKYLITLEKTLDKREHGRFSGKYFYQYSRQQNFIPLSKPKIITPDMADQMRFSFDATGQYVFSGGAAGGVCLIPSTGLDPLFLIGILNSKLIEQYVRLKNGPGFRGGYLNCEIRFLRDIPIQIPHSSSQKTISSRISVCTEKIIKTKVKLQKNKLSDRERERFEREVEANESRIDELVCKLYGVDKISD